MGVGGGGVGGGVIYILQAKSVGGIEGRINRSYCR